MNNKNFWILLILLLTGIVLGGFLGSLADGISWLSWLNFGLEFRNVGDHLWSVD